MGRACVDQTFVLRRIIKESVEHQRALLGNFVDFEKAFNRVSERHYGEFSESMGCQER